MLQWPPEGKKFQRCGRKHRVADTLVSRRKPHGGGKIHAKEPQHERGGICLELVACPAALRRDQWQIPEDKILVGLVGEYVHGCNNAPGNGLHLPGNDRQLVEIVGLEKLHKDEIVVFGNLEPLLLPQAGEERPGLACAIPGVASHRKHTRTSRRNIDGPAFQAPDGMDFKHVVRVAGVKSAHIVAFRSKP